MSKETMMSGPLQDSKIKEIDLPETDRKIIGELVAANSVAAFFALTQPEAQ